MLAGEKPSMSARCPGHGRPASIGVSSCPSKPDAGVKGNWSALRCISTKPRFAPGPSLSLAAILFPRSMIWGEPSQILRSQSACLDSLVPSPASIRDTCECSFPGFALLGEKKTDRSNQPSMYMHFWWRQSLSHSVKSPIANLLGDSAI